MSTDIDSEVKKPTSEGSKLDAAFEESTAQPKTTEDVIDTGAPLQPSTNDESAAEKSKNTYTEMAASAANSATSAAFGMKDNVFSMFGGGAKKEKKEEPGNDPEELSGSSKVQKEAEVEGEVSLLLPNSLSMKAYKFISIFTGRCTGVS